MNDFPHDRSEVLNLDRLEAEIRGSSPTAALDNLDHLAQMSAEAVLKQYEATAAGFSELAKELKDRIAKLQAALDEAGQDLKLLERAAAAILEKGKQAQALIEEMGSVSKAIRELCAATQQKIG